MLVVIPIEISKRAEEAALCWASWLSQLEIPTLIVGSWPLTQCLRTQSFPSTVVIEKGISNITYENRVKRLKESGCRIIASPAEQYLHKTPEFFSLFADPQCLDNIDMFYSGSQLQCSALKRALEHVGFGYKPVVTICDPRVASIASLADTSTKSGVPPDVLFCSSFSTSEFSINRLRELTGEYIHYTPASCRNKWKELKFKKWHGHEYLNQYLALSASFGLIADYAKSYPLKDILYRPHPVLRSTSAQDYVDYLSSCDNVSFSGINTIEYWASLGAPHWATSCTSSLLLAQAGYQNAYRVIEEISEPYFQQNHFTGDLILSEGIHYYPGTSSSVHRIIGLPGDLKPPPVGDTIGIINYIFRELDTDPIPVDKIVGLFNSISNIQVPESSKFSGFMRQTQVYRERICSHRERDIEVKIMQSNNCILVVPSSLY